MNFKINKIVVLTTLLLKAGLIIAGPVRIGNGDDGDDLQSFSPIKTGKILETRNDAVKLLKSFEVNKINGLGALIPELENTKLYMTKKGLSAQTLAKLGAFKSDGSGLIYARTLPQPYAATRFFPASEKLDKKQLIALHIHEALHRSLPKSLRENESVTSQITQSITSPDASFDNIKKTVNKYLVKSEVKYETHSLSKSKLYVPEKSRLRNPSKLAFEMRQFQTKESDSNLGEPLKRMYLISSHLYPFGENENAFGLGFDASLIQSEDESFMGPLSISGRYKLYTYRDFDIEGFIVFNQNTLSDEELKNSLLGRDSTTMGITIATQRDIFFIENDLFFTSESEVRERIGNIDYTYSFGSITGVQLRAGAIYKSFLIGGFTEALVSDNFRVEGGDFSEETGRNRILSWGPRFEYRKNQYSLVLKGRFLLDSTKDTSYDYLSNIMGYGVGQGSLETQINIFF